LTKVLIIVIEEILVLSTNGAGEIGYPYADE
jgi:hypothetical protein